MPGNWFWQPDTAWVNTINTTNLRTISGVRMAVAFTALGGIAFAYTTYQAFPWHIDPCLAVPCLESPGRARAADFAKGIYESMGLFLAAVIGLAVGGYLGKRLTDTDHVERKEHAKKAPVMNITQERPALPPVNILAEDQSTVKVETAGAVPAVQPLVKPPAEPDARTDDERGDA